MCKTFLEIYYIVAIATHMTKYLNDTANVRCVIHRWWNVIAPPKATTFDYE